MTDSDSHTELEGRSPVGASDVFGRIDSSVGQGSFIRSGDVTKPVIESA